MSTETNDGGPAFSFDEKNGDGSHYHSHPGMSLRDWFAGSYRFDGEGLARTWAEAVMGSEAPDWAAGDMADCVRWWCEAEARVRYIHADAMLSERAKSLPSREGRAG